MSLIGADGAALEVGRVHLSAPDEDDAQSFLIDWDDAEFDDYFLSMRPFKCLEGPAQLWCRVPYPYEIARRIAPGVTCSPSFGQISG